MNEIYRRTLKKIRKNMLSVAAGKGVTPDDFGAEKFTQEEISATDVHGNDKLSNCLPKSQDKKRCIKCQVGKEQKEEENINLEASCSNATIS
ncbi:hypothetical protein PR048_020226 [Dryococelus australis]|uniref:Uncharacterized protein n=1 Tax=Dryococelus australis TaxID=614101 RepID=A0ABQ9H5P7_9NEOP|nr:hypothetical protein PR048_020226 [Dryococelus australis]